MNDKYTKPADGIWGWCQDCGSITWQVLHGKPVWKEFSYDVYVCACGRKNRYTNSAEIMNEKPKQKRMVVVYRTTIYGQKQKRGVEE